MKRIYTIGLLALLFMPFCANRKGEQKHVAISSAEITAAVELDVLKFACERRLAALEAVTMQPAPKATPKAKIEAVSASEAVHQ